MTYDVHVYDTGKSTVLEIRSHENQKRVVAIALDHQHADTVATIAHCVSKGYITETIIENAEGFVEIPRLRRVK